MFFVWSHKVINFDQINYSISLQIQDGKGDVTITNDGATILKQMQVIHPAAKMVRLVFVSVSSTS